MTSGNKPFALRHAAPSRLRQLHAAVLHLLEQLATHELEEDLLKKGIEALTTLIEARYGAIGILDDTGQLKQFVYTGITPEEAARIGRLPEGRGLLGAVVHEDHVLRLDDMSQDPRSVGFPPNHPPMKSLLAAPISHQGRVYGRVYLSGKISGEPFSDDDEILAGHYAGALAMVLAYHRSQAERNEAQETLQEVAHALSATTGEEFFPNLVLTLSGMLGVDYAFVGEIRPEQPDVIRTIAFCDHGRIVDNIDYRQAPDTPCGSVECKTACHFPDGALKLFPEDDLIYRYGIEAFIGHPLLDTDGRLLGLLVAMHEKPVADKGHIQTLLQLCASRAAAEIERRRSDRILSEVALATSSVTGEAFFRELVNHLAKALQMDFAFVGALDREGHAIHTAAFHAHGKFLDNITYELRGTPCETVVGREVCVYSRGVQQQFPEDRALAEMGIESYIGAPLFDAARQPLGILALMSSRPLGDRRRAEAILKISAARAAAELERQRAEQRMHLLSSAVENTADSVVITDADGVIQYVNPAYEKTTGYARAEAVGKQPNLVKSGKHEPAFYERLWHTIRGGQVFREVFINRRKNGELYYEQKTITPLRDSQGRITRFISTGKDVTERRRAEEALARSAAEWTYSMDFIEDAMYLLDTDDKVIRANRAFYRLTGLSPDRVIGHDIVSIMHPRGEPTPCRVCQARRERRDCHLVMEPRDPDNPTGRPIEVILRVIRDAAGAPTGVLMVVRDLMPMRETERVLRENAASLANAQRIAQLGNWDWNIVTNELRWSDEIYRIFGLTPQQFGATYEAFLGAVHPDDRQVVTDAVNKTLHEREPYSLDHRIVRPDGTERIVHEQAEVSYDETGKAVRMIGTVQDVTEYRQAMERLHYLANYDPLTGLPNRVLLQDRLNLAMAEAERRDRLVAVMFLDLDRFKIINDTLGHDVGDALLKHVAERLKGCVRAGDTISRLGGDEFTVVLANVAHVDDAARVARKIIDGFVPPFSVDGRELFVSTSIGITLYPFDDNNLDSLLRNADAAMYHAKEMGRNTFQFYTAELNRRTARRLQLETALRHAVERDELLLHYQPQVDLKTGRVIGAEALLRWQHPEMGLIPPLDFIPLAEETGLIIPIGEWVLRAACHQARAWHRAGFHHFQVAVNLSGRQIQHRNLAKLVKQVLRETGLGPRYLDLELTESLLMHNSGETLAAMEKLHALGVAFSMDDFGTGYSSLSYLKRFPIDTLKIDQSFVRDIPSDPDDAAIAQAIIAMAHSLGIQVIAEGVETARQLSFMRSHKCDGMQGYYFSKPVPAEAMMRLLQKHRPLRWRAPAKNRKRARRAKN